MTDPKKNQLKGKELRDKTCRIMKASPTISKAELAELCGVTEPQWAMGL